MARKAEQKKYLVIQSNQFVRYFRHDETWTKQRQDCYFFLASLINRDDEPGKKYRFSADFMRENLMMTDSGTNYKDIMDTLKALRDKSYWIRNERGNREVVSILQSVEISEETGMIEVQFHRLMQPYLFNLKKLYTLESYGTLRAFDCKYTSDLYSFLLSYFGEKGEIPMDFDVSLKELKERLYCQYDRWPDIKRFVIDKAIDEINSYSSRMRVSYTAQKEKNKIISLQFHLWKPNRKDADNSLLAISLQEAYQRRHKQGIQTKKTKQKKEKLLKADEKLKEIETQLTTGATLEEIAESTREYINLRREAEQPKLQWEGREDG